MAMQRPRTSLTQSFPTLQRRGSFQFITNTVMFRSKSLMGRAVFDQESTDKRQELMRRAQDDLEDSKQQIMQCFERWKTVGEDEMDMLTQEGLLKAYAELLPQLPLRTIHTIESVPESCLHLLAALTPSNAEGLYNRGAFFQGTMVWRLMQEDGEDWLERMCGGGAAERDRQHKGMLLVNDVFVLMQHLSDAATLKESKWAANLAAGIIESPKDWKEAILLVIAFWVVAASPSADERIIREKLVSRLRLEAKLSKALGRFLNWSLIFSLYMVSLLTADKGADCRGIRSSLVTRYALDDVAEVKSIDEVSDFLKSFSAASASMAPLSDQYFGAGAELRLLHSVHAFTEPRRLPETMKGKAAFNVREAFTLQAWLQLTDESVVPPAGGLPIFRRALRASGAGAELSCLSWNFPPSLAFGAHDFGGTPGSGGGDLQQERVVAPYPMEESRRSQLGKLKYHEYEQMVLHSLVVDGTSATFYTNNATVVHAETLSRIVTNCESEMTTLGSNGLTLATATYLPRALSPDEIREVYAEGSLLGSMAYMVQPRAIGDLSEVEQLAADLEQQGQADKQTTKQLMEQSHSVSSLSTSVITFREEEQQSRQTTWHDPSIDTHLSEDPVLGIPVMKILGGPETPDGQANHLNSSANAAFPRYSAGRGITMALWTKWGGNGYVLSRAIPHCDDSGCRWTGMNDLCWYFYLYPGRIEASLSSTSADVRGLGAGQVSGFFDGRSLPGAERVTGASYRHLTMVVDPTNVSRPLRLCLDGRCTDSGFHLESGSAADCEESAYLKERAGAHFSESLDQAKVWIAARPQGMWPYTWEVANLKVFDRALSDAQVSQLFEGELDPQEPGKTVRQARGCRHLSEYMDTVWTDEYGHDCSWYYRARIMGLRNCDFSVEARKWCQVACQAKEVCYGSLIDQPSMRLWSQQVEIRSRGTWGSMCIASSTTAAREAIRCGENAVIDAEKCAALGISLCAPVNCSQHEDDEQALLNCLGDVTWVSVNAREYEFVPCRAILEAHNPSCTWDDAMLENVSLAVASNEEWSLSLWFETLSDGCHRPDIRLIDGNGATFARVKSGAWSDELVLDLPGGAGCRKSWDSLQEMHFAPFGTSGAGAPLLADANLYDVPVPQPGEKHLLVFGRKRRCGSGTAAGVAAQVDGIGDMDCEDPANFADSPAGAGFLRVINIMSNLRLSPITLSASYPSQSEIALLRYAGRPQEELKIGPERPQEEQMSMQLEQDADLYREKSMLISPPLLVQSRRRQEPCSWHFADRVIDTFLQIGRGLRCEGLYTCSNYSKNSIYQCHGPGELDDGLFFGRSPRTFNGRPIYMELLSTITDTPVVVRRQESGDHEVLETSRFVDTLTDTLEVMSVFFSPQAGISTVLTVRFTHARDGVKGSFDVKHLVPLFEQDLLRFQLLHGLALLSQLPLALHLVYDVRQRYRKKKDLTIRLAVLCMIVATFIASALMLWEESRSAQYNEELVEKFVELDWRSQDEGTDQKLSSLLRSLEDLLREVLRRSRMESAIMLLLIFVLICITRRTHMHPKLALLTSTLESVFWDLLHLFVIFFLILWGFALIGTWRFGYTRKDMSHPVITMWTLMDAILSPPGELALSAGTDDVTYMVYVLLFHMLSFFFLVNCFLAIIVEGFTNAKTLFTDVDHDIMTDIWLLIRKTHLEWKWRWGEPERIADFIQDLPSTQVSVSQLQQNPDLFRSKDSAEAFYLFYMKMDLLLCESSGRRQLYESLSQMEVRLTELKKASQAQHLAMQAQQASIQVTKGDTEEILGILRPQTPSLRRSKCEEDLQEPLGFMTEPPSLLAQRINSLNSEDRDAELDDADPTMRCHPLCPTHPISLD